MRIKKMNKKADLPEYFVEFFSILTFFAFVFVFTVIFLNLKSCTSGASTNTIGSIDYQNNLYALSNLELLNYQIPINSSIFGTPSNRIINHPLKTAIPIFISECDNQKFTKSCSPMIIIYKNDKGSYVGFHSGYYEPYKHTPQNYACYYLYMNITDAFKKFYLIKTTGWVDAYGQIGLDQISNYLINISFGNFIVILTRKKDITEALNQRSDEVYFSQMIPLTILKNNQQINYTFTMRK